MQQVGEVGSRPKIIRIQLQSIEPKVNGVARHTELGGDAPFPSDCALRGQVKRAKELTQLKYPDKKFSNLPFLFAAHQFGGL
jgi:hypothetical protein